MVPELETTTAYPPAWVLVVENASDAVIEWEFSGVGISIDISTKNGGLLPEGCQVIPSTGVRAMTEKEVSDTFGISLRNSWGRSRVVAGYYRFEPGGRLMVITPVPWDYRSRFDIGEHKVYALVFRRYPFGNIEYENNDMSCPALTVKVAKP